jgi:hypothetical protein
MESDVRPQTTQNHSCLCSGIPSNFAVFHFLLGAKQIVPNVGWQIITGAKPGTTTSLAKYV